VARLIIVGGTVFRDGDTSGPGTVVIDRDSGTIEAVMGAGEAPPEADGDQVLDATGLWVAPGFVELYASVPDPGREHREDVASAAAAGARGGYTTVFTLPDTEPVVDNGAIALDIQTRAARSTGARVVPHGAATVGNAGVDLSPYGELTDAGCKAVVCGDFPIATTGLARNVLDYANAFELPVIITGVDHDLGDGLCDEGIWSTRLGLPASAAIAERVAIERDCALAELTGATVHFARVSTSEGLGAIARAKERGVRVTCSCTPHHLHLTAAALADYDPNLRVWPPLRSDADVKALREGLASGLVDAVVTDHQPLHSEDKRREFMSAPAGISGLETTLGLVLELVHSGELSATRALYALSGGPARVVGDPARGVLRAGAMADIVLVDPEASWLVEPEGFASKGKNTPFGGRVISGRATTTIVAGDVVWQANMEV